MSDWKSEEIVLASASPRRAQLLSDMGFKYVQYPANKPELELSEGPARGVALKIAKAKARAVYEELGRPDKMILAADTIVVLDGRIMGKPTNEKDAYRMLARLSGKKHEVITAVSLIYKGKTYSFASSTTVLFREMLHDEVLYYIEHYRPMDKAGAYAIQEWIGMCKIAHIEGSYTNVMGLPTEKVYTFIRHLMEKGRVEGTK